jgi:DNA ligase-1
MLADDFVESQLRFPLIAQPKIDGVRGLNLDGPLTGRSLKKHKNIYTTNFYSKPQFVGFDGELAAAAESDPALCRKTSSALSTITGEPFTLWHVFDFVSAHTRNWAYEDRYKVLEDQVAMLQGQQIEGCGHLRLIPSYMVPSLEGLNELDSEFLNAGYEGTIIRDPKGRYKEGRSTVKEGGLLRIKRFVEEEAVVISITEGEENGNVAQTNELGNTFRSTHQANMVPNGMVGSFECKNLKDGKMITVSPGKMPHDERKYYFEHPEAIVAKVIKYKHFPKGVKDKPRFPTFQCIRAPEDM